MNNKMQLIFKSLPENERFARSVISCFSLHLNPNISEIADIKTAVSEAVTNSIVHGYPEEIGDIILESEIVDRVIHINIFDNGVGIENLDEALEPFYTTKACDERSGMGFTIMKSFMDDVRVESALGQGTKIYMKKTIKSDIR